MMFAIVLLSVLGYALSTTTVTVPVQILTSTPAAITQKPGSLGTTCTSTKDCGEGYCCVTRFLGGKKKRVLFDDLFGGHNSGHCEPERKENDSCHVFMDHDIFNPNLYEDYCPCMTGLECRGETVDESGGTITHHNPKCQPHQGTASN